MLEDGPVLWLGPERASRNTLEQGRMDVPSYPLSPDSTPSKDDGCTAGSTIRRALLGVADRCE